MSLLTKEQIDKIERIRLKNYDDPLPIQNAAKVWEKHFFDLLGAASDLLTIIDDLQSRAPKQYTEQELMSEFEKLYPPFEGAAHEQIFKGWLMCARFLGALKADT